MSLRPLFEVLHSHESEYKDSTIESNIQRLFAQPNLCLLAQEGYPQIIIQHLLTQKHL